MTERRDTYKALDLALRIGEFLLASGAGAADVTATMLAVTSACGVTRVTADVTYVDLALRHQPSAEEPASIQVRRVTRRAVDYDQLTEVDRLVHDLVAEQVGLDEAREQVARLITAGHGRKRWLVTLAWGVMGTGVALTLGGSPIVCALAFLAACAIDRTQVLMSRWQVPGFYQQVAGGFVATLIAVAAAATQLHVNPSRVVTAGIVMLLAGIGLVGATQDAILGFPVTATARLMEALLATTGIIGGVSGGLALRGLFGVELENFKPGAVGLAEAGVMVVGASLAAAAFGYASFAPGRALAAIALVAAIAQAASAAVASTGLGKTWGAAVAATAIGAVSFAVAGRIRVPPLVIVVPSVVPLLPGLAIYSGLALLAEGRDGVVQLATAAATAIALAAGVIFGQYLSHPVIREAHRLESRLSGPRLVGSWLAR